MMKGKKLIFPVAALAVLFLAASVTLAMGSKVSLVFVAAAAALTLVIACLFVIVPVCRGGRGAVTRGRISLTLWCAFILFALFYLATYPEFNPGRDLRPLHYISELVFGCAFTAASVVLMILFDRKRFWDMLYFPALGVTLVLEAVKELYLPAGSGYEIVSDVETAFFWAFVALVVVRIVCILIDRSMAKREAEEAKR